jgi:putative aldouronate transport system substrate-binding protein
LAKTSRKWLTLVTAIVMVLSILSACSSKNSEGASSAPAGSAGSSSAPSAEAKKDPVTLKIELFDRNNTPAGAEPITNNFFTRYIQENFGDPNNIKIEWVTVPRSEEVDKLNVLMAANQAPDLVFTYDIATVRRYARDGGLTDLGPYIEQYGQNLKKVLGDDVLSYGIFEGKQYAVVAKRVIDAQVSTFIRQDWLDELGLPVPTTTEEFYNTLVAFKKAKPNAIPYGGQTTHFQTSPIKFSFWEWDKITDEDIYAVGDYHWVMPGNKEAMRFLNKLYNEGLIDKDFPLSIGKDTNQFQKNMVNGLIGAGSTGTNEPVYQGYLAEMIKNNPGAKVTVINPFKDARGKTPKPVYSPNGIYILVPKASEARAAEVIKYLDWMAQPENIIRLQNGTEGETFEFVDGIPRTLDNDAAKNLLYNYFDYCIILNGKYVSNEDNLLNIAANASDPNFMQFTVDSIATGSQDGVVRPRVLKTIESEIKYGNTLTKLSEEDMFVKVVTAPVNKFDEIHDAEVAKFLKSGAQEVIDEKRAAYREEYPNSR